MGGTRECERTLGCCRGQSGVRAGVGEAVGRMRAREGGEVQESEEDALGKGRWGVPTRAKQEVGVAPRVR